MKNKIKGIPVAFFGIILALALTIDVPMVLLHSNDQAHFDRLENGQLNNSLQIRRVEGLLITPTPEATPSASPTPSKVYYQPATVKPTALPTSSK